MIEILKKILMWAGMAVLVAIPLLISFAIGHHRGRTEALKGFKPDTLIIDHWDTLEVSKPIYLTKRIVDTMWLSVPESGETGACPVDSVPIPREQAHYKDTSYEAWVSGYRPALDSIRVFRHDQTIYIDKVMEVKKKSRWGIGLQAGYGAYLVDRQVYTTPYVGVGITYNLFSW